MCYTAAMVELEQAGIGRFNRRFVARLADGASVETVLYRNDTLCVSTQVGCAVGCPFCASGSQGLERPLSFEELVGQVQAGRAQGGAVDRVTLSGVGEPLHAFDAVSRFIHWCRGERIRPSVTTSGGPLPRLRELLELPHNGVTVSVHAGTEATRARLVPRGPALSPLFDAVADTLPRLSNSRRRKVALAYLVVDGHNESDAEVDAFVARALPLGVDVHLFDVNPVATSPLRGVGRDRYQAIYERMRDASLVVRMSSQARLEPVGGCGTLVSTRRKRRDRCAQ